MHPIVNIAILAARQAGNIIMNASERLDTVAVSEKEPNDFVTEIDHRAEQAIIEIIKKHYPNHSILAEESGEQTGDETTWIIDPLDGTTNFIHGLPHYCISIAVRVKQRIEHAVIFDPVRHELFSATRGEGARLNNRRLRVSKTKQLSQALIATGFPFRNKPFFKTYIQTFEKLFMQVSGIRRAGSAALDLAYVAAGRFDGYCEYKLAPWDIAAGILLVKEAGGLISDCNGGENYLESGDIIAANPTVFKGILQTLRMNK